jgi:nucleotide-binding universal stress UspA family protein
MAASCVLCGVDDSPIAADVIRAAARLRDRLGLRLVIAHAVREPVTVGVATVPYAYPYQSETEIARDTPEELLEAIARRSPEAQRAELRAATGDPVETLLSLADEEHAELLVVGSRGRGALKAALLGSVSWAVAMRASCPVVIVPPGSVSEG